MTSMKQGIKPLVRQPKRNFHEYFGGTALVPDFNLDAGLWNPSQVADNAETECVGYHVADTFTDFTKDIKTPDFSYAGAIFVENEPPTTAGVDPLAGLQGGVIVGSLSKSQTPTMSAAQDGELFVANFSNWQPFQKTSALLTTAVDVHNALGFTDSFTSIISTMWTGQVAVALCTPWYHEWMSAPGGILPMPANINNTAGLPWHCHSAKGQHTIGSTSYIIDKPWIGTSWGQAGFGYMSQDVANAVFQVPGTGALVMVMIGKRWLPLCKIVVTRTSTISYCWPRIMNVNA